jgi:hypothetical protein
LALVAPFDHFAPLLRSELRFASERHTAPLCTFPVFLAPFFHSNLHCGAAVPVLRCAPPFATPVG